MLKQNIFKNIKNLLNEVVESQYIKSKQEFTNFNQQRLNSIEISKKLMRPLVGAVQEIKSEVVSIKGLQIEVTEPNPIIYIKIHYLSQIEEIRISADVDHNRFQFETKSYFQYEEDDAIEKEEFINRPEQIIKIIIQKVGIHVGKMRAIAEREGKET